MVSAGILFVKSNKPLQSHHPCPELSPVPVHPCTGLSPVYPCTIETEFMRPTLLPVRASGPG